ncbi:TPA: prepilin-type N-terminal cleavage/methylation domain-containing protein [Streptococcus pyogenes]|nr:prepilin-type N-terminal cleavage/methylation domain-containing protein [Streptococcus pyogenes]HEQ2857838.1 prepilin-type N-terminal cleavage/methylation domain-containing protein [Streptococcus pyogenes]HEQ2889325.1 prepilin-type N-terminal cleavage/methylation domain-containing protein [Streptococcus pyogenes]HEQ3016553.1 prepilin-type N-terminal cleavage/methylation domain-containing protein [Streptococcus pyogenes]HEQ3018365.1 prepilin-type N-terminal cleavage/methylation domain-contain
MINQWNNLRHKNLKGFTLLEMLLVILVISVLMLLFVPNLSKQKDRVTETGNAAVVKLVENQAELYELSQGSKPSLSQLKADSSITEKQEKAYQDYYDKHKNEKARLSN